jgi:hypothetical protein
MLFDELHEAIRELPVIDVHSHVNLDHIAARGLTEVLCYHMVMHPMRSAAYDGSSLPGAHQAEDREALLAQWFERWPMVESTGFGWILKQILSGLYEFEGPLTADRLDELEEAFRAKTSQADWPAQILDAAGAEQVLSSQIKVDPAVKQRWQDRVRFTIEDAPGGGNRECGATWQGRLGGFARILGRDIDSVDRLREAVSAHYRKLDWSGKYANVAWVSSRADFRPLPTADLDRIIADAAAGREPEPPAARLLEAALVRATCAATREHVPMFQFCYGTQFLTDDDAGPHPIQRAATDFASSMGYVLGEFPDLHFNLLNGYEPHEPIWCGMVQGYRNFSISGYWWDTFFPSVMRAAWHRRLDMVPLSRLVGFFSDGWCADWVYGRVCLTRRVLAIVLAEKVEWGFYTKDQAVEVARQILVETPRRLFRIET